MNAAKFLKVEDLYLRGPDSELQFSVPPNRNRTLPIETARIPEQAHPKNLHADYLYCRDLGAANSGRDPKPKSQSKSDSELRSESDQFAAQLDFVRNGFCVFGCVLWK